MNEQVEELLFAMSTLLEGNCDAAAAYVDELLDSGEYEEDDAGRLIWTRPVRELVQEAGELGIASPFFWQAVAMHGGVELHQGHLRSKSPACARGPYEPSEVSV